MQGDRNDACVCERVGVYKKEMENKEVNLINKGLESVNNV